MSINLKIAFPPYLADVLGVQSKLLKLDGQLTTANVVQEIARKVKMEHPERYALYRVTTDPTDIRVRLGTDSKISSFGLKSMDVVDLLGTPMFIHLTLPDGTIQYHYQLDAEAPIMDEIVSACRRCGIKNSDDKEFQFEGSILEPDRCFRELGIPEVRIVYLSISNGQQDGIVSLIKQRKGGILSRLRNKSKPKEGVAANSRVFCVPLADISSSSCDSNGIPLLVCDCIAAVEERGLDSEGIYRLSGSADEIQKLKQRYDDGERPDLSSIDIDVVTGTLKQWLRDLPEPLLTFSLYSPFTLSSQVKTDSRLILVKQLVNLLPDRNKALLTRLLDHMVIITDHSTANQMKMHNVATVLAPNLLRQEGGDTFTMVQDTPIVNDVVMNMMANHDILFQHEPHFVALANTLYAYAPESEGDEVSFDEDMTVLVQQCDGEWWYGEVVETGAVGLCPANYLETSVTFEAGVDDSGPSIAKKDMKTLLQATKTEVADEVKAIREAVSRRDAMAASLSQLSDTVKQNGEMCRLLENSLMCMRECAAVLTEGTVDMEGTRLKSIEATVAQIDQELEKLGKYLLAEGRARAQLECKM